MTESEIIIVLLAVAMAAVLCLILIQLRKNTLKQGHESPEVLQERIQAREAEIERLGNQYHDLKLELDNSIQSNNALRDQLSRQEVLLKEERTRSQEKIETLQNAREQMNLEFKNLANEILEQKSKNFTEMNKENIQNILNPLNEKIVSFEKKVSETYDKEAKERFSLAREIKSLQELNVRISTDAVNLTNALKGESKTQGIWGEMILERILEKSGLEKGREYEVQVNLKTEQGNNRQPDVIVHLPDKKDIVIDSKVSLKAYENYSSAENEPEQIESLKMHIQSIRKHIKELSNKEYPYLKNLETLDFVLMFLPVEAAFTAAVQHDNNLFTEAFDKNIVIVGPSTLLATLRTIQNIWRYEHQNRNATEIATRAGALYDKFVNLVNDIEDIGKHIDKSSEAHEQAMKKLSSGRGNLIRSVENIKGLGAKTKKQLPASLLDEHDDAEDSD